MKPELVERAFNAASAIRASADAEHRHLTAAEVTQIERLLALTDIALDAYEQQPGQRQTLPSAPGGGAPNGHWSADPQRPHLLTSRGETIPILGKADRMADLVPHAERQPIGALADVIAAMATGDWDRVAPDLRAQQSGAIDSSGGYLLSRGLSSEIIDRMRSASVVMQAGVRVVPMAQRVLDYARVIDSPDPMWRAENQVIRESAVVLDRISLEAKNLGAIVRSSIELLDDTPSAGELIRDELATEMAQELDRAVLSGSGGVMPLGIVNQSGISVVGSVGSYANYSWLMTGLTQLWARNTTPTALILTPYTRARLAQLPTGISGDNTVLVPPRELTAFPWLTTSKLAGGGSPSNSMALLGDFSTVIVGMRQQLRIEVSDSGGEYQDAGSPSDVGDAWSRNQLRVRSTLRCDIVLHQPSKVVKFDGIEP